MHFSLYEGNLQGLILTNKKGQSCIAGSRIFIQEGIYDEFLVRFAEIATGLAAASGDPFETGNQHGPQISQTQFNVRS